jgi:hypothetical protein
MDPHFRSFFKWVSKFESNSKYPAYIITKKDETSKFQKESDISNVNYVSYGEHYDDLVPFLHKFRQDITMRHDASIPADDHLPLPSGPLFARESQISQIVDSILGQKKKNKFRSLVPLVSASLLWPVLLPVTLE